MWIYSSMQTIPQLHQYLIRKTEPLRMIYSYVEMGWGDRQTHLIYGDRVGRQKDTPLIGT